MVRPTIDLTGLSFETAMKVVAADLDRTVLNELRRCTVEMVEQGARGDDLDAILAHQRDQLEAWRERVIGEMRGWLIDGGSGRLH